MKRSVEMQHIGAFEPLRGDGSFEAPGQPGSSARRRALPAAAQRLARDRLALLVVVFIAAKVSGPLQRLCLEASSARFYTR